MYYIVEYISHVLSQTTITMLMVAVFQSVLKVKELLPYKCHTGRVTAEWHAEKKLMARWEM